MHVLLEDQGKGITNGREYCRNECLKPPVYAVVRDPGKYRERVQEFVGSDLNIRRLISRMMLA